MNPCKHCKLSAICLSGNFVNVGSMLALVAMRATKATQKWPPIHKFREWELADDRHRQERQAAGERAKQAFLARRAKDCPEHYNKELR